MDTAQQAHDLAILFLSQMRSEQGIKDPGEFFMEYQRVFLEYYLLLSERSGSHNRQDLSTP